MITIKICLLSDLAILRSDSLWCVSVC